MNSEFSEEIKKYPFVRITLALIAGIVFSLITEITSIYIILTFFCLFAVFLFLHIRSKFSQSIFAGIAINLILFSAGAVLTSVQNESARLSSGETKEGLLIGEINADPKTGEKTVSLEVNILAVKNKNSWLSAQGKTLLFLENDQRVAELKPGDKIVFSPQLNEIENKGNPEEFDYKKYLSYNLILSSDYLKSDEWQLLETDHNINIRYRFLRFRTGLIKKLEELGLNNDELAVASALALGYKDSLSDEVRHAYSSSGAMHILAVSGLHVGIIYGIIVFLLSFVKIKKLNVFKVVLTIVLIWAYAALTGLSPSVCRAALMFSIIAAGKLQKHGSGSLNAVAASAFILLVINPLNLTNLGFQLSYVAVTGIILLYDNIYKLINVKNKFVDKVWSLTAVSVAAQIATAPLCLYYFHQFSNYFLITNYLLIPVSTIAIWLVIIVFATSGLGVAGVFFAKILGFVIKAMNFLTAGIESLPFSVTHDVYISFYQMFLLYLAIILFAVFFFYSKKHSHFFAGLIAVIMFATISLSRTIDSKNQKYFIVYNVNKASAINVIDGSENVLFANLDSVSSGDIEFSAKNNWLKKGLEEEKYVNLSSGTESILSNIAAINDRNIFFKKKFISFDGLKAFVLDNSFRYLIADEGFNKITVDYIILSNSPGIKLSELRQYFNFKTVIIDSSNKNSSVELWMQENKESGLDIYNVKSEGAFVKEL